MKKCLFTKRAGLPAPHAGTRYGNPVHPSGFVRNVSRDIVKTMLSKQLATSRNMGVPLKAIGPRAVPFLLKYRPRNSERRISRKLLQQELNVIILERNICVQIADDFVFQITNSCIAGVESVNLPRKRSV